MLSSYQTVNQHWWVDIGI